MIQILAGRKGVGFYGSGGLMVRHTLGGIGYPIAEPAQLRDRLSNLYRLAQRPRNPWPGFETTGSKVRVLFEDDGALEVPSVFDVKFDHRACATVTFGVGTRPSIVVLRGETCHLEARQIRPGCPYYYTIRVKAARREPV